MACTCLALALAGTFAARLPDALLPDDLNLGCLWLRFGFWCFPAQAAQQARAGARAVRRRLLPGRADRPTSPARGRPGLRLLSCCLTRGRGGPALGSGGPALGCGGAAPGRSWSGRFGGGRLLRSRWLGGGWLPGGRARGGRPRFPLLTLRPAL